MILKQYYLACLSHASYLIGDEASGEAIVVDPQRDVDAYVADAAAAGLTIRGIFLTHFHADFVAGHIELRERTGAPIYLSARGQAEYAFTPLQDGQQLAFGAVRIDVLATPGHTPEGLSYVVTDLAADAATPHAVLTGDTLFIGDVGRPDLLGAAGTSAEELAGQLYDSLHGKLLTLPDETLVYPAHGAGSACGKNLSQDTVSTIGAQKRHNYALQPMSKAAFVAAVTADQPAAPGYFSHDVAMNRRERPTLEVSLGRALTPLDLDAVLARQAAGAYVVDVRESDAYEAAHLASSLNVGLDGRFASWAGNVLDGDRPIVLVADPGTEREAALRLGRIGYDDVVGYLAGGFEVLKDRPELLRATRQIGREELVRLLADAAPPVLLDVRGPGEWADAHIAGSFNVPLPALQARLAEIPRDRPLVVHCKSGYRSAIAAGLLERAGFTDLVDFAGGFDAWQAAVPV